MGYLLSAPKTSLPFLYGMQNYSSSNSVRQPFFFNFINGRSYLLRGRTPALASVGTSFTSPSDSSFLWDRHFMATSDRAQDFPIIFTRADAFDPSNIAHIDFPDWIESNHFMVLLTNAGNTGGIGALSALGWTLVTNVAGNGNAGQIWTRTGATPNTTESFDFRANGVQAYAGVIWVFQPGTSIQQIVYNIPDPAAPDYSENQFTSPPSGYPGSFNLETIFMIESFQWQGANFRDTPPRTYSATVGANSLGITTLLTKDASPGYVANNDFGDSMSWLAFSIVLNGPMVQNGYVEYKQAVSYMDVTQPIATNQRNGIQADETDPDTQRDDFLGYIYPGSTTPTKVPYTYVQTSTPGYTPGALTGDVYLEGTFEFAVRWRTAQEQSQTFSLGVVIPDSLSDDIQTFPDNTFYADRRAILNAPLTPTLLGNCYKIASLGSWNNPNGTPLSYYNGRTYPDDGNGYYDPYNTGWWYKAFVWNGFPYDGRTGVSRSPAIGTNLDSFPFSLVSGDHATLVIWADAQQNQTTVPMDEMCVIDTLDMRGVMSYQPVMTYQLAFRDFGNLAATPGDMKVFYNPKNTR